MVSIIIVIGILASGCASLQKQPEKYTDPVDKLTFETTKSVPHSTLLGLAEEKGYFEKNRLLELQ